MHPKRPKPWPWIILVLFVVCGIGGMGLLFIGAALGGATGNRIGLIELSGVITDEGARGLLGGAPAGGARNFIADVNAARTDKTIKAVVIRINSPGGAAAASQEMYQAVRRLRKEKPVVCSMGDVAASGGYYVASACNKIYANGSTLTGSIGVISEFLNYGSLFKKLGLEEATIKSGKFKDAGSPTRPLTPEERQLFQQMIGDVYSQFTADVVDGRKEATKGKLTLQKLKILADGRVYTGRQAKSNLLIDANGGLYEAIEDAGQLGGISGTPKVKNMSGGGGLAGLLGAESQSSVGGLAEAAGAAFARGAIGQLQNEAQTLPRPQMR